jgi:molybdopterin converting factor small subunit
MRVNVKCFAKLAKDQVCDYKHSTQHEMSQGATISDLIAQLGLRREDIKTIFLNSSIEQPEAVLHDGDNVALAPVTGGM